MCQNCEYIVRESAGSIDHFGLDNILSIENGPGDGAGI